MKNINGWFSCNNITFLMRKTYLFRMIGKTLYCKPLKGRKPWKITFMAGV